VNEAALSVIGRPSPALRTYLLGRLPFEEFVALQRRLVFDVGGNRRSAALVICDHTPCITVGREGSRLHILATADELAAREWPVHWIGRGGGAMLHLPGQVACYPILPLDLVGLHVAEYIERLLSVALELMREYDVPAVADPDRPGVRVNGRRIAHVGIAVRDDVACFGLVLNVAPDLAPFRLVHCDGDSAPMTSLLRETSARVRLTRVRQQLIEIVGERFGFARNTVFHSYPEFRLEPLRHAVAHRT
jgi:lipoyl(octanoyl) transferase